MKTVADYTEPSLMVPLLHSRNSAEVTVELGSSLQRQRRIGDLARFCHAVMSRESLSSTAMAPNWALPHARMAGISRLAFALGRAAEPLPWFGGEAVSLVFLFAVPETDAGAYLGLVASLAKLAQDPLRLKHLADAGDSRTMFQVLQEIPVPHRPVATLNS